MPEAGPQPTIKAMFLFNVQITQYFLAKNEKPVSFPLLNMHEIYGNIEMSDDECPIFGLWVFYCSIKLNVLNECWGETNLMTIAERDLNSTANICFYSVLFMVV